MIIKLTVNDNNFAEVLENYMKDFYKSLLRDLDNLCEKAKAEEAKGNEVDNHCFREYFKMSDKVNETLNPNINESLTDEQKEFLVDRVKKTFKCFVEMTRPEDVEYLSKNLEVSFPESFLDKDENGENAYWFQHSGTVIMQ